MADIKLGGNFSFDPLGKQYFQLVDAMDIKLNFLAINTNGFATDDDVREIVNQFFPRGIDNALDLLQEVHDRCFVENNVMKDQCHRGHFPWPLPRIRWED